METSDPLLERIVPVLAQVPGVVAVALGGSRATGVAHAASDYDIGLYFSERAGLDIKRLLDGVTGLVDDPDAARVTEVGGWGPWIVGDGWLAIAGKKVDLLYRPIESVERVIRNCREGRVSMDYQPRHPHGFCSSIWMGEVALGRALRDSERALAALEAMTILTQMNCERRWLADSSGRNARTAIPRGDKTYLAGCAFRSLACAAQVLFAVNRRYLIMRRPRSPPRRGSRGRFAIWPSG